MGFSPGFYIGVVIFVLAVNVWLMVRFLKKAAGWGKEGKREPDVRKH